MREHRSSPSVLIPCFDTIFIFRPTEPGAFLAILEADHATREAMRNAGLTIACENVEIGEEGSNRRAMIPAKLREDILDFRLPSCLGLFRCAHDSPPQIREQKKNAEHRSQAITNVASQTRNAPDFRSGSAPGKNGPPSGGRPCSRLSFIDLERGPP